MSSNSEYSPMDLENPNPEKPRLKIKSGILKSGKHIDAGTIRLDPKKHDENNDIEYFQPVYHGEQVIGIIHKCTCERVSEIHFEYDSETSKGMKPQLEGGEPK